MARTPDRAPVEVGRGTIDFKTIFARAERAGVKHFLVEQDEPKSGLDSIKESLEYLRRLEW
jgi:sugar phosphate isomerase/epimerase